MSLDGQWDFYNLKVKPDYSQDLCEMYSGIRPGYHMNKRHWISVDYYGDAPDRLQKELIFHSYCQAANNLPSKIKVCLGLENINLPDDLNSKNNDKAD